MSAITDDQILDYVVANISSFHRNRLEKLAALKLTKLLSRKNPYLFRSKNIGEVGELVKSLLDAHLSSQEETLFGDFLEGLAIYIAEVVHGGWKSTTTGIDLEFAQDGSRYIVSIKSGPNWGNSSQITKLKDNFSAATRVVRQGNPNINVVAVNGCCYGRNSKPEQGTHLKICGQDFWEMISGDANLYTRIIEPLAHSAKERNEEFMQNYGSVINKFAMEFGYNFCDDTGAINWLKLVEFSSKKGRKPQLRHPPKE